MGRRVWVGWLCLERFGGRVRCCVWVCCWIRVIGEFGGEEERGGGGAEANEEEAEDKGTPWEAALGGLGGKAVVGWAGALGGLLLFGALEGFADEAHRRLVSLMARRTCHHVTVWRDLTKAARRALSQRLLMRRGMPAEWR